MSSVLSLEAELLSLLVFFFFFNKDKSSNPRNSKACNYLFEIVVKDCAPCHTPQRNHENTLNELSLFFSLSYTHPLVHFAHFKKLVVNSPLETFHTSINIFPFSIIVHFDESIAFHSFSLMSCLVNMHSHQSNIKKKIQNITRIYITLFSPFSSLSYMMWTLPVSLCI